MPLILPPFRVRIARACGLRIFYPPPSLWKVERNKGRSFCSYWSRVNTGRCGSCGAPGYGHSRCQKCREANRPKDRIRWRLSHPKRSSATSTVRTADEAS